MKTDSPGGTIAPAVVGVVHGVVCVCDVSVPMWFSSDVPMVDPEPGRG
jgi:hypothetical protein